MVQEFNNLGIRDKVIVQNAWYSVNQCIANPNKLYVFGDNTLRVGMAGQASIRKCLNSTGLATKLHPGMEEGDFMSDNFYNEHCSVIEKDLIKILKRFENPDNGYNQLIFPYDGLGTGLSQLPEKAPKVYKFLCDKLASMFGVYTDANGKLYIPGR